MLLAAIDVVLAAAYYADYLLGHPFFPLTRQLNLGEESNVATWYASMKWALISLVFFAPTWPRCQPSRPSTYPILLVPLLCLLFSIDEVAQLHERLGGVMDVLLPGGLRHGGIFQRTGIWMLVLIPPAVVVAILGGRALAREYAGHRRILVRGGVAALAFVLAAGGVELLANLVQPGTHLEVLEVLVEETGEMLAATAVYWAAVDLQRASAPAIGEIQ